MTNRKAFISEGAFVINGAAQDAVITASYDGDGGFQICLEAMGADISVVIDDEDIRWIREHLGIGSSAEVQPSRQWTFMDVPEEVTDGETLDEYLDRLNGE